MFSEKDKSKTWSPSGSLGVSEIPWKGSERKGSERKVSDEKRK